MAYTSIIGGTTHKRGNGIVKSVVKRDPEMTGPASERRFETMEIEGQKPQSRTAKIPTVVDGAFKGLEARARNLEQAGWELVERWFEGRDAWTVGKAAAKPEDEPQTPAPAAAKPKRQRKTKVKAAEPAVEDGDEEMAA